MPSTVVRRAPKWPRAPCGTLLVPAPSSSAWLSGGPLPAPRGSQGGAESPFSFLGVRPWPWDSAFGISSLLPTPGELRAPTCSTRLVAETQGFQALLSREAGVACTSNAGCPNALDCVAPGERRRGFYTTGCWARTRHSRISMLESSFRRGGSPSALRLEERRVASNLGVGELRSELPRGGGGGGSRGAGLSTNSTAPQLHSSTAWMPGWCSLAQGGRGRDGAR